MVSSDFCKLSYLFRAQLSCNFLKIVFFQPKGATKFFFLRFLCCKVFCLPKHYKIGVSATFWVFCCWKRKDRPKKWQLEFLNLGFFGLKMAVSWRTTVFQKMLCWNPYFHSVFGGALFGPSSQKREMLDTHQKKKKNWLMTEKLIFKYFCVFFLFFVSFLWISLKNLIFP